MKSTRQITCMASFIVLSLIGGAIAGVPNGGNPAPPADGAVFVTSQGLTYNTFAAVLQLPPVGPFQLLVMTPQGSVTEFGPGDPGYLGGRWWVDVNADGEQDPQDMYFLCPLLPPGY